MATRRSIRPSRPARSPRRRPPRRRPRSPRMSRPKSTRPTPLVAPAARAGAGALSQAFRLSLPPCAAPAHVAGAVLCTPQKTSGPVSRAARGLRYRRRLGQVVADVAEDVLDLTTKEDHGDDDGNRDDSDDECILDEALALFVTEESDHLEPPFPANWTGEPAHLWRRIG